MGSGRALPGPSGGRVDELGLLGSAGKSCCNDHVDWESGGLYSPIHSEKFCTLLVLVGTHLGVLNLQGG